MPKKAIFAAYRLISLCLLLIIGLAFGGELFAQQADSLNNQQRELPQALQRRMRLKQRHQPNKTDSIQTNDTTPRAESAVKDKEEQQLQDSTLLSSKKETDITNWEEPVDTAQLLANMPQPEPSPSKKTQFIPDPAKATWLAVVFPGGGQIYNRKYWKLPIVYGGFVGCAYALTWNNQMYSDYSQAYLDIMDDSPETDSYLDLLPPGYNVDANLSYLKKVIKRKKDSYRRYRDLSIFCFIGVYIISIIDAYVDAELASFDISKDLSLRMEPTIINNEQDLKHGNSYGLQCSLRF